MQVFVTGATGWVGRHVVDELIGAGHRVVGLARSDDKADALRQQGARVLRGTLDDLDALTAAARDADAIAHLAFNHDFSKFADNAEQDRRAIEAFGEVIAATGAPMLVTSGVAHLAPGRTATEQDVVHDAPSFPRRSDTAGRLLAERGQRVGVVRLAPSVHGVGETHGFVPMLIDIAKRTGVSAYLGDGANRWPGVHVTDAARVYRLALESGVGERAYHAVAEEGVAFRDIATAIGRRLGLPVEARDAEHFGWFAGFVGEDMPASSARTREVLGWTPSGPGLVDDIAQPEYYAG